MQQLEGNAAQAAGGAGAGGKGQRNRESKTKHGKQDDLDQKFEMLLDLDLIDVGEDYYKEEILFNNPE